MPYPPKLTAEQRQAVRRWAAFGRNISDVARRLGVSHQTIRRAIRVGKRERSRARAAGKHIAAPAPSYAVTASCRTALRGAPC